MLIDNAGWHIANDLRVPPNISLVHLPPYSPELNAIEKVWLSCTRFARTPICPTGNRYDEVQHGSEQSS
jgi:transposase